MYFEAIIKNRRYKVQVNEDLYSWKISLEQEGKSTQEFEVSKKDFTKAEEYISFLFNGKSYLIDVVGQSTDYTVFARNSFRSIKIFNDEMLLHESFKNEDTINSDTELKAGMPGKVIEIFVKPGQKIEAGKPLMIMEAMKMENELRAPHDVVIKEVCVNQGESVEAGAILIKFESKI